MSKMQVIFGVIVYILDIVHHLSIIFHTL